MAPRWRMAGATAGLLGATLMFVSPLGAQTAEPECGQTDAVGATIRANLQSTSGPLEIPLGRKGHGVVQREVRLTWADACTIGAAQLEGKLIALKGVLVGDESSFPTDGIEVQSVDVVDKNVRLVIGIDRATVEPGRYEGTMVLEAENNAVAIARGEVPVVLKRQEAMFGPHRYWSPFVILIGGLVAGLIFGWFRAMALANAEAAGIRNQRVFAARNIVALVGGLGAGIAAWSVQYVQTPDYRLDAKAVMSLFGLVAAPVVTALLTFLKPDATARAVTKAG